MLALLLIVTKLIEIHCLGIMLARVREKKKALPRKR